MMKNLTILIFDGPLISIDCLQNTEKRLRKTEAYKIKGNNIIKKEKKSF